MYPEALQSNDGPKHLILHHHSAKNGGTTLDSALIAQFGSQKCVRLERDGQPITGAMLTGCLDRNPDVHVISSHGLQGQLFEELFHARDCRVFHLMFVRRPLPRLISLYKYLRRSRFSYDLARRAAKLEPGPFIRMAIEHHPHVVDNPQVNILARHGFYHCAVAPDDLEMAWARYRKFALCAPVERYDEAMVVLEYFNSPVYAPKGLDLSYVRQNVSERLPGEDDLPRLIGEDNYRFLERLHEFDEQLCARADVELNRRIAKVPRFSERLADFRERCRHRSDAAQSPPADAFLHRQAAE